MFARQDHTDFDKYVLGLQEGVAAGEALPSDFYHDPYIYDIELARAFDGAWVPVCRVDELPRPQEYMPASAAGHELILTRGDDGALHVFFNSCSHRSMRLVDQPASGRRMVCPYHKWTFGLDGQLHGAPLVGRTIDRSRCGLGEVRHETWQGWLFINPAGNAAPLHEELSGLTQVLDGWGIEEMVSVGAVEFESEWNWKVMWENFNEFYHHLGTHSGTLEPLLPARTATALDNGGQPWSCASMACGDDYLYMQPFVDLTNAPSNDMHLFSVFPLLCAGVQPGSAFWLRIIPQTATKHRVSWEFLLPPSELDTPDFEARLDSTMQGLRQIHLEDMDACRLVQQGHSGRLTRRGQLTEFDKPVSQLHNWLLRTLAGST
ncbi:aromatic ring-hydroxylating dioxygenase subunit alpha [Kibdelosporangium aridum]|nr:aromatic ring-hydroxylating dioxygenase subunit alpha [Kibdelosporangium aridum]